MGYLRTTTYDVLQYLIWRLVNRPARQCLLNTLNLVKQVLVLLPKTLVSGRHVLQLSSTDVVLDCQPIMCTPQSIKLAK